jgi:2-succinyl-5-enolpyruvyl-6-hydroxy-3-cyclohexene-1-carboxylate synthase
MDLSTNANTDWMSLFVTELVANGLEAACIAPGSRSTPLTLAFATQPGVRLYRHLDERSAGFFALGLAMASGKPVALVCTSGTAAANFHPAVIEAYYSGVPLLVLTADRPPELRGSGANQTIDQIKMFGDHVRWSVEAPVPQTDAPDVARRHVRTLAARAVATADGLVKGPVHLNFPFRKPLEPMDGANHSGLTGAVRSSTPYTHVSRGRLMPDEAQIAAVAEAITAHRRGLIICGPDRPDKAFAGAVADLAERCSFPILADPLSQLRHGPQTGGGLVLGGYHLWLPALGRRLERPELILRFGAVPTSSALAAYLNEADPPAHYHIRADGQWADDQHLTREYVQCDAMAFCSALTAELQSRNYHANTGWADRLIAVEGQTWAVVDGLMARTAFFDGAAVRDLLSALPDDAVLFAGNSLPIRHVDTFDRPTDRRLAIYGNRGASGIDGNVSTALGLAAASGKRVVALLGDITFYHDMNGLLAARQQGIDNVTFVVINNDGGGIFHQLPIARHDPPFTDLFLTPHGLTFEHAAAMYGLEYTPVADRGTLLQAMADGFARKPGPRLIEITTDSQADHRQLMDWSARVAIELQHLNLPVAAASAAGSTN